jgi:hypothetical protein
MVLAVHKRFWRGRTFLGHDNLVSFTTNYFTSRFNNCPINSSLAIRIILAYFLNRFQPSRLLRIQANGEIN